MKNEYLSIIILCSLLIILAFIGAANMKKHKQQEKYEIPQDTLKVDNHLV